RSRQEIESQAEELYRRLERAVRYRLLFAHQQLSRVAQQGAFARMKDVINRWQQRLDDLRFRLEKATRHSMERERRRWEPAAAAARHYDARRRLAVMRQSLERHTATLASAMHARLLEGRADLDRNSASLEALSPLAILNRGYALVFDAQGEL